MPDVSLFFKVTLQDGRVDDFLAEVAPVVAHVRENEPGTLDYRVHTTAVDPNVVWFYERYADEAAMTAHAQSPAIATMFTKVGPLMDGAPEMLPGSCLDL